MSNQLFKASLLPIFVLWALPSCGGGGYWGAPKERAEALERIADKESRFAQSQKEHEQLLAEKSELENDLKITLETIERLEIERNLLVKFNNPQELLSIERELEEARAEKALIIAEIIRINGYLGEEPDYTL